MQSSKSLVISILGFRGEDRSLGLLRSLPQIIENAPRKPNWEIKIIFRNNAKQEAALAIQQFIAEYNREEKYGTKMTFIQSEYNLGFGGGHNATFEKEFSDIFLVLNNDLGFENFQFLNEALHLFESNPNLALVGASGEPNRVTPYYGNGISTGKSAGLTYAEGSVLFVRSSVARELGLFARQYEWAMFEDSDLSFRMRQAGYEVGFIDITFQHWRSTSVNSIPAETRAGILESNRSKFFARWNKSILNDRPMKAVLFDLKSDGLGDVISCLPAVFQFIFENSKTRIEVACNQALHVLFKNFGNVSLRREMTRDELSNLGDVDVKSISNINYSTPFYIGDLLAAKLGIGAISPEHIDQFASAALESLAEHVDLEHESFILPDPYFVVALETTRVGHHGRFADPIDAIDAIAYAIGKGFTGVVVGLNPNDLRTNELVERFPALRDIRGQTDFALLAKIISKSAFLITNDSAPFHLAQLFRRPSAVVFGAVTPSARTFFSDLIWPIWRSELNCLGCYHRNQDASIPYCMRQDQACITNLSSNFLSAVTELIENARPVHEKVDWMQRKWQAEFLFNGMNHPLKFEASSPVRQLSFTRLSDMFYQIASQIDSEINFALDRNSNFWVQKSAEQIKLRNNSLVESNRELREEKERYKQLLRHDVNLKLGDLLSNVTFEDGLPANCPPLSAFKSIDMGEVPYEILNSQSKLEDGALIFDSEDADAQIVIHAPAKITSARSFIRVSGYTTKAGNIHVYWRQISNASFPKVAYFTEENSVWTDVGVGSFNKVFQLPIKIGSTVNFRIDPIDQAGSRVVLCCSLFGVEFGA